MARAHVEFIQAQVVPWSSGFTGGSREGVESKILSFDPDSGAMTAIVRYPPGWTHDAECLAADEEFFVFEGALVFGGLAYTPYHYAYLPSGHERGPAAAPDGAVVLTFFESAPRPAEPGERFRENAGAVECLDANVLAWGPGKDEPNLSGNRMSKTLRIDPDTEDRTWLSTVGPGSRDEGDRARVETHPVVEEMYLLSGDLAGNAGLMKPGAYFWRPPGIRHGPYGSRTGFLSLFRCKDGPLVNFWSDDEVTFTYDPEHQPALPPEFESLGREPWQGGAPY